MISDVLKILFDNFNSLRQINKILLLLKNVLELFLDIIRELSVGIFPVYVYFFLQADSYSIVFDLSDLDLKRVLHWCKKMIVISIVLIDIE